MHFLPAINSDISVLIVCNKTGGTIKGDIKKKISDLPWSYLLGTGRREVGVGGGWGGGRCLTRK